MEAVLAGLENPQKTPFSIEEGFFIIPNGCRRGEQVKEETNGRKKGRQGEDDEGSRFHES
ncbi:MAG: hypothetical protein AAF514_18480 [Verrucomicrobiota bacterium]